MATWEDGPEYAPLERPDEFVAATTAPLSQAARYEQSAGLAPIERPVFTDPPVPVAPLSALVPHTGPTRDPSAPFAVVSSTMTANTDQHAWAGVHYTAPPAPPPGGWGPPVGPLHTADAPPPGAAGSFPGRTPDPLGRPPLMGPAPTDPLLLSHRSDQPGSHGGVLPTGPPGAPHTGPFPVPGTPGWFAPPPVVPQWQPPVDHRLNAGVLARAITPGVLICLVLGGLIGGLAPLQLVLAALLATRVRLARSWIQRAFAVAVGLVVAVGVLTVLIGADSFSSWWTTLGITAQVLCWAMLVAAPLLAVLAWQRGERPSLPETTWG